MKRILFGVLGIVVLLIAAAAIVPFLIPNEVYKARIETEASKALGRDVILNGDVSLSVFPSISARIGDVTVANPDGFSGDQMITAGSMKASVRWAPLLSKRVEVAELSFVDADVSLERLADGRVNWIFSSGTSDPENPTEPTEGGFEGGIDKARLVNASVRYSDAVSGRAFALEDFSVAASMRSLAQALTAKGDGVFDGQRFDFDLDLASPEAALNGAATSLKLEFGSDLADVSYDGDLTLGAAARLDGAFTLEASDLSKLAEFASFDAMDLSPFGSIAAEGTLSGPMDALDIQFSEFSQKGNLLDLTYKGGLILADDPRLSGDLSLNSSDAGLLLTKLGIGSVGNEALESFALSGKLNGALSALNITGMEATHSGELLNATYAGTASLGASSRIEGRLDASSDQLRALLSAFDVTVAPGETLKAFSFSADTSGSLSALSLSNLDFALDDVTATGTASIELDGPRPLINAILAIPALDLTPFMGNDAEPSTAPSQGWSQEPLALDSLKALDAELILNVDKLTVQRVTLTDADVVANLRNGQLSTTLNSFKAFGGNWQGVLGLDTNADVPTLAIDMTADSILMSDLLSTFTSTDKLTGTGAFHIQASSTGASMDALIRGLAGQVSTNLADGEIKGVDFAQLRRSLEDAQGALARGELNLVLSPQAETDFSSFTSLLKIENGVARIESLDFLMPALGSLTGLGKIDLGNQSFDLRLKPEFDRDGAGDRGGLMLNGIDIPIRMSGDWSSPSFQLDTDGLQSLLRAELTDAVSSEISDAIGDQLGDEAGGLLSDVLGLPRAQEDTPEESEEDTAPAEAQDETADPNEDETEEETEPEPVPSIEDQLEDRARDALSDLLNGDD
ncbi:MAG: AsmA family protein [Hyphomonadaceae bacterium]